MIRLEWTDQVETLGKDFASYFAEEGEDSHRTRVHASYGREQKDNDHERQDYESENSGGRAALQVDDSTAGLIIENCHSTLLAGIVGGCWGSRGVAGGEQVWRS